MIISNNSRISDSLILNGNSIPPRDSALSMWLDPHVGVETSGNLVNSWTSRVGSLTFTSEVSTKPTLHSGYLEFDGIDDYMFRASDTQSYTPGASRATLACWGWLDAVTGNLSTFYNGTEYALTLLATDIGTYYEAYPSRTAVASATAIGQWVFHALVIDAEVSPYVRAYCGTTPSTVTQCGLLALPITPLQEASGQSRIGSTSGVFPRLLKGRIASIYVYNSAALSIDELKALASMKVPY